MFSYGRTMLKAMARAATDEPNVFHFGMPIDEEISIRGIFVLTHATFD